MEQRRDLFQRLGRKPLVVRSGIVAGLYVLMVTKVFGMLPIDMDLVIDLKVRFDGSLVWQDIESQVATGRDAYLVFHLIDYLFILFFYPLLRQFALRLGGGAVLPNLALAAGLMDLLENIWIDAMLLLYPLQSSWMPLVVSAATTLKFLSLAIALVGMLGSGVGRKLKHNRRR